MTDDLMNSVAEFAKEHLGDILVGLGIAGFISTGVIAAKCAKKRAKRDTDEPKKLTKETVIQGIKDYGPAIVVGAASTASIILGVNEFHKKNAAIMAICAVAESTLADYKKEVTNVIGKEEEAKISDKVDIERARKLEEVNQQYHVPQVIDAYASYQPFFDVYSGRPFYSSEADIERAINELNAELNQGYAVYLNDFYDRIDLERNTVGSEVGWDSSLRQGLIELRYGAYRDNNGIARTSITFVNKPQTLT